MAVTHADLEPSRRGIDLGSKTGAFLMIFSILFGFFCFILCLIAESTRSQVTWMSDKGDGERGECIYSGSGKTPVLCAVCAFVGLAIGIVVQHTYMVVAASKSIPQALVTWDHDSDPTKTLTWQAGFFFFTTWICFSIGEIMLLIGLIIESGHLKNWSRPRPSCLIVEQGLFCAAGVFGLAAVFLPCGLYTTALRAQRLWHDQENVHREVLEASVLYASPPRSPRHRLAATANENPVVGQNHNVQQLFDYLSAFDKHSNLV